MKVSPRWKSLLVLSIKLLVLVSILIYLGPRLFDVDVSRETLTRIVYGILISQPAKIIGNLFAAIRLHILSGKTISIKGAFISNVLVVGFNPFLPLRTSELIKPIYLARSEDIPMSRIVNFVIFERLFDLLAIGIIAIGAISVSELDEASSIPVVVAFCLMMLALIPGYRYIVKSDWLNRLLKKRNIDFSAEGMKWSIWNSGLVFFLSLLVWLSSSLSVYQFLEVALVTDSVSAGSAVIVFVGGLLGGLLAFAPGAIGSFEAVSLAAMKMTSDIGGDLAVAAGLRIQSNLYECLLALVVLFFDHSIIKESWKALRRKKRKP